MAETVQLPGSLVGALSSLGLSTALGYLRMLRVSRTLLGGCCCWRTVGVHCGARVQTTCAAPLHCWMATAMATACSSVPETLLYASEALRINLCYCCLPPSALQEPGGGLTPLQLCLGMPMQPTTLCEAVCERARAIRFLDQRTRRQRQVGGLGGSRGPRSLGTLVCAWRPHAAQHGCGRPAACNHARGQSQSRGTTASSSTASPGRVPALTTAGGPADAAACSVPAHSAARRVQQQLCGWWPRCRPLLLCGLAHPQPHFRGRQAAAAGLQCGAAGPGAVVMPAVCF